MANYDTNIFRVGCLAGRPVALRPCCFLLVYWPRKAFSSIGRYMMPIKGAAIPD
jgi:hypothetical protein